KQANNVWWHRSGMMSVAFPPKSPEAVALPARRHSILAGFLSYLLPGLGQIYQGRVSKGVFFLVVLLGLFFAGQALGDWKNVYWPNLAHGGEFDPNRNGPNWDNNPWKLPGPLRPLANVVNHRWQFAGQFWIGVAAWPAILQYNNWPLPFAPEYQRGPNILVDE